MFEEKFWYFTPEVQKMAWSDLFQISTSAEQNMSLVMQGIYF